MVNSFPGLRRVTWGCLQQIPPCVLEALRPGCQLDISSFSLRSLFQPPTEPLEIDSHELALATSPLLTSLALRFDFRGEGLSSYNYDVVMDMTAGAAPNLQRVSLLFESSGSSPASVRTMGVPSQLWRHDLIQQQPGSRTVKGQLKCLELYVRDTGETLREWSAKTDFAVLHTLKLVSGVDTSTLTWLSNECRWSKLTTLSIAPEETTDSTLDELYIATQAFLKIVPPLESLKLTGDYDRATFQVALETHGRILRQLILAETSASKGWLISPKVLEFIHQHCPILEALFLPVKRSAGDANEVAIYRALGRLPAIKRLCLTLDQSSIHLPLEHDHEEHGHPAELNEPTDLDIRIALINYAVDEQLAQEIFRTISSSKQPGLPLLEYVELRAEDKLIPDHREYPSTLKRVFEYLRRSWTCERVTRDDCSVSHECLARETDQEQILDREYDERTGYYDFTLAPAVLPIFRSIWSGDGSWKDEWYSCPLASA